MKYEKQHVGGFKDQYGGPVKEGPHHDRLTIDTRAVLWGILFLVLFMGFVFGSMIALYYGLTREAGFIHADSPLVPERPIERPPGMIVDPGQDLRQLRRQEAELLHSYDRIDPPGTARIPIERAMQLVAEQGPPFGPRPEDEQPQHP